MGFYPLRDGFPHVIADVDARLDFGWPIDPRVQSNLDPVRTVNERENVVREIIDMTIVSRSEVCELNCDVGDFDRLAIQCEIWNCSFLMDRTIEPPLQRLGVESRPSNQATQP